MVNVSRGWEREKARKRYREEERLKRREVEERKKQERREEEERKRKEEEERDVEDLKSAIIVTDDGDLKKVTRILQRRPYLLRTDILGEGIGCTPLHYACHYNRYEIALFFIREEQERVTKEREEEQDGQKRTGARQKTGGAGERQKKATPSYNMRNGDGLSPVFLTKSSKIVEEMLKLDDLQVTRVDGTPLLWHCAMRGCVSERVASDQKLAGQYGQRWWGSLPLEEGLLNDVNVSSCVDLVKGLHRCETHVKAMNLRALLANSRFLHEILKATWEVILSWLDLQCSGLTDDEALRLRAIIMKTRGENSYDEIKLRRSWYDRDNPGHVKLLWLFVCDGNLEMVKYMQSLPGIEDQPMSDGTTAFSMALAKSRCDLIKELLQFKRKRDIDLATYAQQEPKINEHMKQVLKGAEVTEILGPNLIFVRGLVKFVSYIARLILPGLVWVLLNYALRTIISVPVEEESTPQICQAMIGVATRFPYFNEDAETNWKEYNQNTGMSLGMKNIIKKNFQINKIDQYKVHDKIFMEQNGSSFPLVAFSQSSSPNQVINCHMIDDLIKVTQQIEKRLNENNELKHLKPKFTLAGSMAEGTRFGYANELDLGLKFEGLQKSMGSEGDIENNIAFKVGKDPFSLEKADTSPSFMDMFFNSEGKFLSHKFKCTLLYSTEKAVTDMFQKGENPPNIHCIVTNNEWQEGRTPCRGECREKLRENFYKHCQICPVVVSQTKIGLTLQFVWKWPGGETSATNEIYTSIDEIYTSIDVIPEYTIVPIPAIKLAKTVNTQMVQPERQPPPKGFVQYLKNYDMHYKVNLCQDGLIYNVVLKEFNFYNGRNTHIRPAQPTVNGEEKFSSERMRKIYGYIKFLKKNVDGLELSSFAVKKDQYKAILDTCEDNDDRAVIAILSQPEFRSRVEGSRIDLKESNKQGKICFKPSSSFSKLSDSLPSSSSQSDSEWFTQSDSE